MGSIEYDMEDDTILVLTGFKNSEVESESYFEYFSSYGDNWGDKRFSYIKVTAYESFIFTLRVSFVPITNVFGFFS